MMDYQWGIIIFYRTDTMTSIIVITQVFFLHRFYYFTSGSDRRQSNRKRVSDRASDRGALPLDGSVCIRSVIILKRYSSADKVRIRNVNI